MTYEYKIVDGKRIKLTPQEIEATILEDTKAEKLKGKHVEKPSTLTIICKQIESFEIQGLKLTEDMKNILRSL